MKVLIKNNLINIKNSQIKTKLTYRLFVTNGSGDGWYYPNTVVTISGQLNGTFDQWTGDTSTIANVSSEVTTITMMENYNITATYSVETSANGWSDSQLEYDGEYQ